jgi:hypothetical protein
MKIRNFNLKKIAADFLLLCGMVSALCTTFIQVKDTFFKEEVTTENESAPLIISQTIQGLPPGVTITKTISGSENQGDEPIEEELPPEEELNTTEQPTTESIQPTPEQNSVIIILSSLMVMCIGVILRQKFKTPTDKETL